MSAILVALAGGGISRLNYTSARAHRAAVRRAALAAIERATR